MQDSRSPQSRGSESLWPKALPGTLSACGQNPPCLGAALHPAFESSVGTGTKPPGLVLSTANTGTLRLQTIKCWDKVSGSPGEQPFPISHCLMLLRGTQPMISETLTGEEEVRTQRYARRLSRAHNPLS